VKVLVVDSGGREAKEIAYKGIEKIKFEGIRYRTDIGK
jgi:phosphoribosylamine-glycine ligase